MSAPERTQLSKKTRFEVFKRDLFKCQYCGKGTPQVTLEVDHIIPVCNGGTNSMDNLATACFDCNRGKAGNELTQISDSLEVKMERMREKEEQYRAFTRLVKRIEGRAQKEIDSVAEIYCECFPGYELNQSFINSSVKKFIEQLGLPTVKDAMWRACSKCSWDRAARYFCGICWNIIRNT